MRRAALIFGLTALPCAATADALVCEMAPEAGGASVEVAFEIDRTQFAGALSPDDPPRNRVTQVRIGAEEITAEPILVEGGYRGFLREGPEETVLMVLDIDGRARLSRSAAEVDLVGTCEDVE